MRRSWIILCLLFLVACDNPTETNSGGQNFKFKLFADNLESNLKGKSAGYAFTISYKNMWIDMRSGGQARIADDAPALPMSPFVPFSAASLSKTITAAAAMKALYAVDQQNGKPAGTMLDQPIGAYLPSDFSPDANFKAITFRQLMQHQSGIGNKSVIGNNQSGIGKGTDASDVDYASLKAYVGSQPDVGNKSPNYSNTNFALFRFLIPNLAGMTLQQGDPGTAYATAYMQYVRQNVLSPVGLGNVTAATDTSSGLDYHYPVPAQPYHGMDLGDLTTRVASQGWVMSTQQFAVFLREINYSGKIISQDMAKQMKSQCMGYEYWTCNAPVASGSSYTYWAKGGMYPGCWSTNSGEFLGQIVLFSNDVSVVIFVNSNLAYGGAGKDKCFYVDLVNDLQPVVDAFNATLGK